MGEKKQINFKLIQIFIDDAECFIKIKFDLHVIPSESYAAAAAAANDEETLGGAGVNGPLRTDI